MAVGVGSACDRPAPERAIETPSADADEPAVDGSAAEPTEAGRLDAAPSPTRDGRPSIALFVLDTVRADAVSAYGEVEGTTPTLDALAAAGTLYTRAFAPSSWTLPSHATLFTGLGVDQHAVGVRGREVLDASFETLAERLAEAGYHTAAFSENIMLSEPFGLAQGFAHFSAKAIPKELGSDGGAYHVVEELRTWLQDLPDAPFFLFVNLFEAHDPYEVRPENPFLPEGVHVSTARAVQMPSRGPIAMSSGICDRLPAPDELEILRGLYLGDVRAADRKLGRILGLLRGLERELVSVVVSDHGEHLGGHALLGHEFTVHNAALHVPLVVHGAPGLRSGRSEAPVTLSDVAVSVLEWAGVEVSADLAGRPLPPPGRPGPERELFAFYGDGPWEPPEGITLHADLERKKRAGCRPEHGVFGDLHAVTRFPFKLIEAPGLPPKLYDLSWDPRERSDLAPHRPQLVADLRAELREFRRQTMRHDPETLDPQTAEALRALGYLH